jgi:hypothetical protein
MIEFFLSDRLRPYRLTVVLGAAALLLVMLLALEWFLIKPSPMPSAAPRRGQDPQAQDNLLGDAFSLPAVATFKQTVDRPVFMESRRPAPPAPAGPPAKTEPPPPISLKLMGVLATPEGQMVLIADAKGKYRRLKPKETLEGWEIVEIMGDRVRLQQGGIEEDLLLVKKHPKGSNPTAQGTPAANHPAQPPQAVNPATGQGVMPANAPMGQNAAPAHSRQMAPPKRTSDDDDMMPSEEMQPNDASQANDPGGSDESME